MVPSKHVLRLGGGLTKCEANSGRLRGGAGRISGGNFFLMNFELLTFLCR